MAKVIDLVAKLEMLWLKLWICWLGDVVAKVIDLVAKLEMWWIKL